VLQDKKIPKVLLVFECSGYLSYSKFVPVKSLDVHQYSYIAETEWNSNTTYLTVIVKERGHCQQATDNTTTART